MNRLLKIEWLKLKHYRPFRILIGFYAILLILVGSSISFFLAWLKSKGADFRGFDPTMIPFYDFPDIWQNLTYIATYFKLLLAFIVIISIANEVDFRTLRQNIIDGMSKKEWLASKLLFLLSLAVGSVFLLFLIGLVNGMIHSHADGWRSMFHSLSFLLTYGFEVFTFLTFALLLTLIIRRAGLVIVGLTMYTLAFEPFVALALMNIPEIAHWGPYIAPYFPIRAINNLIHIPFPRYILQEIQDYVSFKEVFVVLFWLFFNVGMSYWILKKRDL